MKRRDLLAVLGGVMVGLRASAVDSAAPARVGFLSGGDEEGAAGFVSALRAIAACSRTPMLPATCEGQACTSYRMLPNSSANPLPIRCRPHLIPLSTGLPKSQPS